MAGTPQPPLQSLLFSPAHDAPRQSPWAASVVPVTPVSATRYLQPLQTPRSEGPPGGRWKGLPAAADDLPPPFESLLDAVRAALRARRTACVCARA
jgi:hypothetical protein